jgi:hypothetical protein
MPRHCGGLALLRIVPVFGAKKKKAVAFLCRKDTNCCIISIFFAKKAPHLFAVRAVAARCGAVNRLILFVAAVIRWRRRVVCRCRASVVGGRGVDTIGLVCGSLIVAAVVVAATPEKGYDEHYSANHTNKGKAPENNNEKCIHNVSVFSG